VTPVGTLKVAGPVEVNEVIVGVFVGLWAEVPTAITAAPVPVTVVFLKLAMLDPLFISYIYQIIILM
jgi:hypothetical protein